MSHYVANYRKILYNLTTSISKLVSRSELTVSSKGRPTYGRIMGFLNYLIAVWTNKVGSSLRKCVGASYTLLGDAKMAAMDGRWDRSFLVNSAHEFMLAPYSVKPSQAPSGCKPSCRD